MLIDGIELVEGSEIQNLGVPVGTAFPGTPNYGELFYRTDLDALYIYSTVGSTWVAIAKGTAGASKWIIASADKIYHVDDVSIGATPLAGKKLYVLGDVKLEGAVEITGNIVAGTAPSLATHLVNKNYVDGFVSGVIWDDPIRHVNLINDSLSAPPVSPVYSDVYVVAGTGTGAWTGLDGKVVLWNGSSWTDAGLLVTGWRLGVAIESSTTPAGGLTGLKNYVVEWNGASWTQYAPVNNHAVFVSNSISLHAYHQYVYNSTSVAWIEFGGPNAIVAGENLAWTGNTLDVTQGPGSLLDADTIDGYQGSALAVLAENETVTGTWVFPDKTRFGTTPNDTWGAGTSVLELNSTSALIGDGTATYLSENVYYNSGWKYQNTDSASMIGFGGGTMSLTVAPSGTADTAITWTTSIKAESTGIVKGLGGNWLISPGGTDITPLYNQVIYTADSGNSLTQYVNLTTGPTANDGFLVGIDGSERAYLANLENTDMIIYTNNIFRGKIAANGNMLISPGGTDFTPNSNLVIYTADGTKSLTQYCNLTTGTTGGDGFFVGINDNEEALLHNYENTALKIYTNNALRGGITSGGKWIVSSGGAFGTPAYDLLIHGVGGQAFMQFANTASGDGSSDGLQIGLNADLSASIIQRENANLRFYTNNVERGYIQANGLLNWTQPVVASGYLQASTSTSASIDTLLYISSTGNGSTDGTRGVRIEMTVPGNASTEEGVWLTAHSRTATTVMSADFSVSVANGGGMSERMRILSAGDLQISTVAKGIDFVNHVGTAAGGAATVSKVLDHYEEGTWTPVISGSTTAGAGTYSSGTARYTRIGNMVTLWCHVGITAHTGTGNIIITGVPFMSSSTNFASGSAITTNLTFTGTNLFTQINSSSSTIGLVQCSSGASVSSVPMDTSFDIDFTISYQV